MSTQVGQRPGWVAQNAEGIRFFTHFLLWAIFWLAAFVGIFLTFSPAVAAMTTQHAVPYLPANYEVVEDVTNVFTTRQLLGGAGGVGAPQVERSFSAYQERERQNATHFLVISVSSTYPKGVVEVDYFDFQMDKVVHTSYTHQDSPPVWRRWGIIWGSFKPQSATITEEKLVIQRIYDPAGKTVFLGVVAILLVMAAYALWLRPLINKHIFDRILPVPPPLRRDW